MTLLSAALLWLSFPPLGLAWLAWVAPIPMLSLLLSNDEVVWNRRRPLAKTWAASFIFWLATFYFIPFPHPILFIGWFALSAYLAVYTPLFFVAARTMIQRWRVPALIAIPIGWTGLEWIRINFLTGFGMVALSHSQYSNPLAIQIADLSGAYTVTFAMTTFATGAAYCLYRESRIKGVVACVVVATLVAGYGMFRLNQAADFTESPGDKVETVALIQTSIDTILAMKSDEQILAELGQLRDINWASREADNSIDLIVWPESSYPYGNYISDETGEGEDGRAEEDKGEEQKSVMISEANLKEIWAQLTNRAGQFTPVATIIGTSTIDIDKQQIFNSALLLDETGLPQSRYDKVHRVMFGEYVPLLEYFPSTMKYLPIGRNLTPGKLASLMETGGLKIAPNICFESTVPHLIRRQLNTIAADQAEPNVLLNITNDGWFFGTSCLDLHYACNVFRAVELRKPMLVCANTGLSAHIDAWGVAVKKGKRRQAEFLICEIDPDAELPASLYRRIGDAIPMLLGAICVLALVTRRRFSPRG